MFTKEGSTMKRMVVWMVCGMVLAAMPASSQTQPGSWELSAAVNFNSMSTSSEVTSGGHTTKSESEARGALGIDLRVGLFAVQGFSIEPEIYLLAAEKETPTLNLGANLGYTFSIPESPVKPYVTAGYGIGNGIPLMQRLMGHTTSDFDIAVLRAGGGLKIFLGKQVALKIEYRYERYSLDQSETFYGSTYSYSNIYNMHNVLFGLSVFLPGAD
jgi:opacity protein-like surface antigen